MVACFHCLHGHHDGGVVATSCRLHVAMHRSACWRLRFKCEAWASLLSCIACENYVYVSPADHSLHAGVAAHVLMNGGTTGKSTGKTSPLLSHPGQGELQMWCPPTRQGISTRREAARTKTCWPPILAMKAGDAMIAPLSVRTRVFQIVVPLCSLERIHALL